jgi:hypothetical protein
MKRRRLAVLIVLVFAGSLSLGWRLWWLSNHGDNNGSPAALLPLDAVGEFPADRQAGARAAADAVARSGERPEEFLAEVEVNRVDGVMVFHLWHRSAWDPENQGARGNPGGKCRDVYFDPRRGKVIQTLFWQ